MSKLTHGNLRDGYQQNKQCVSKLSDAHHAKNAKTINETIFQ